MNRVPRVTTSGTTNAGFGQASNVFGQPPHSHHQTLLQRMFINEPLMRGIRTDTCYQMAMVTSRDLHIDDDGWQGRFQA